MPWPADKFFKLSMIAFLSSMVFLGAMTDPAHAVPTQIPYSGQISEGGTLVNGTRYFQFALYSALTGGTSVYIQSESLLVAGGIYHTELNAPDSTWSGENRWLGVSINGNSELTPRTKIGSVPYAVRAQVADSAAHVPQKSAWQIVFTGSFNFSSGSWVNIGPPLQITTKGGPLFIVVDVYAIGGSHSTFQPLVDGVWAGDYSSMLNPGDPFWKEGLMSTQGPAWRQWNKAKIYPGIPAGTHTVQIQGATDVGILTVGGTTLPCALQVIELQRME